MDISDSDHDDTLRGLEKAQKTLQDVEAKMKKFKSRRRQTSQASNAKAPFPDLSKYFSHLTNEFQRDETEQLLLPTDLRSRNLSRQSIPTDIMGRARPQDKENCSITINQKVEREKNSSINKIEEYYAERNEILEEKIREMRMIKEKMVRDQKLLLRNNEELEEEIRRQGSIRQEHTKGQQLREKIGKLKEKIAATQGQNAKIASRKKDLQKHIKEIVKLHKESLTHEVLSRPKSTSAVRCNYH